jgi:hypothetical protein
VIDASQLFDEYPYLALPIGWTAPERLAMASTFHGGPGTSLYYVISPVKQP